MSHVVHQPAASAAARRDLDHTVWRPVLIDEHAAALGSEADALRAIFPDGSAPLWGVTPATDGSNARRWARMQRGDTVYLAAGGRLFFRAIVTHTFHRPEVARQLWGEDANGLTWEYMYALDELQPADIPYEDLNRVLGYAENNVVQGFSVLTEERARQCWMHLAVAACFVHRRLSPAKPPSPNEALQAVLIAKRVSSSAGSRHTCARS